MTSRSGVQTAAGVAVAALVLSGCSALQVRTADRESGPLTVGVQTGAGEDLASESAGPVVPAGMERITRDLGAECPVRVSFAIGPDWTEENSNPQFVTFYRGTTIAESDVIIVSCSQAFDDSPEAVVTVKRQYAFSRQGSTVTAERTGTVGAGSYWSFQGVLGPDEIFAIDRKATAIYGARIGYRTNGRLVDLGIEMRALDTDTAAAEDFRQMLPTLEIDGMAVPTPTLR